MEGLSSLEKPCLWSTDGNFSDGGAAKQRGTTPVWKIKENSRLLKDENYCFLHLNIRYLPNLRKSCSCTLISFLLARCFCLGVSLSNLAFAVLNTQSSENCILCNILTVIRVYTIMKPLFFQRRHDEYQ